MRLGGREELTHVSGQMGNILSLDSTLLMNQCPSDRGRSWGKCLLRSSRADLGDGASCLVEDVARGTTLGHHQVLTPCSGGADSRASHGVSKAHGGKLKTSCRIRISANKHCAAKANIELIAPSHETIGNLETEPGRIDAGMPDGYVCVFFFVVRVTCKMSYFMCLLDHIIRQVKGRDRSLI